MKVLIIFIVITITFGINAIAQEKTSRNINAPKEYSGYILYDAIDSKGHRAIVKSPVRYKIGTPKTPEDNDENYKYRNYRVEIERNNNEEEAKNKIEDENLKINSAEDYPLYFN